MTNGSYRKWENVIIIISVVMAIAFRFFPLINKTSIPPSAISIFNVMAAALFVRPVWLLTHLGKFSGHTEAVVVNCFFRSYGKAAAKVYTFEFSDSHRNIHNNVSGGLIFAKFKKGESYNIRFYPNAPDKFIIVPTAYYQAAFSAVIGIIIEIILILVMINMKGS